MRQSRATQLKGCTAPHNNAYVSSSVPHNCQKSQLAVPTRKRVSEWLSRKSRNRYNKATHTSMGCALIISGSFAHMHSHYWVSPSLGHESPFDICIADRSSLWRSIPTKPHTNLKPLDVLPACQLSSVHYDTFLYMSVENQMLPAVVDGARQNIRIEIRKGFATDAQKNPWLPAQQTVAVAPAMHCSSSAEGSEHELGDPELTSSQTPRRAPSSWLQKLHVMGLHLPRILLDQGDRRRTTVHVFSRKKL